MNLTSKIDTVTLFSRGAEVTRLAEFELAAGEHELVLRDLPVGLDQNSLRVEGMADGELVLGGVDTRTVHVPAKGEGLDDNSRRALEKQIEQLEDEAREIEGHVQTAATQKNLMDNLAAMPGAARGQKNDWGAIFDLIGERLPNVHSELNRQNIALRKLREKIDDLRGQLVDEPAKPLRRTEVKVSAVAKSDLKGELTIRYQMAQAGWQPLYDARLDTRSDTHEPVIDLVRRASISQNTGENWDNVALTLSTTRPSAGTSAPALFARVLDLLPVHPPAPAPMMRQMKHKLMAAPAAEMAEMAADAMPDEVAFSGAMEEEAHNEAAVFQARFEVPGRVSLEGKGAKKKVRLGSQTFAPRLEIRSTPVLDPTAFLHADFKLEEGLALLPGQVALYRDNVYVGDGHMPLVNVGERYELGFGVDDQVSIKRKELARAKGQHGLIKSENTDEFHFQITINNHHQRPMPVRILDRLPASNHEKLKVEMLKDMSEPDKRDVDDQRGVLAYEFDLSAGEEKQIDIHYRISWPKGEHIG